MARPHKRLRNLTNPTKTIKNTTEKTKTNKTIALKLDTEEKLKFLNLNIQGMKSTEKRPLIEKYMIENEIDIGILTETHINTNNKETRKKITYYFSGGGTKEQHYAGVAIIIKNELNNYIEDIQPINERLMIITIKSTIPITIVAVYAHTAQYTLLEKQNLYEEIKKLHSKHKNKSIVHIVGDFNARIQTKTTEEEICIGKHTFNKNNITLEKQDQKMEESRQLFIDLCLSTKTTIMNTQLQKRDDQLATHRRPTHATPPFTRPNYEMIDHWPTETRWKNTITNAETEAGANITTDHLPMIITHKTKLARINTQKNKGRKKYEICNKEQNREYNEKLKELNNTDIKTAMAEAAENTIPTKTTTMKKDDMSQESLRLIDDRAVLTKQDRLEEAALTTKLLKKQRKKDKIKAITESLNKDIDIRDRWLGLRQLKKGYQINPFAIKNEEGQRISKENIAEEIAIHLENTTWNNKEAENKQLLINTRKIVETNENYNTNQPTTKELKKVIKRMKRRKACGPDEIPMEMIKELDDTNLIKLYELICDWWNNENMPKEETRARVVSIFKKGDTSDIGNYRPISLLNSTYKIFTAILVDRILDKLDKHLQRTQFGFRKNKSTANAIYLIRRLIDNAERANKQELHMLLLDWEKAFDKLTHNALFIAMEKMNIDQKLINLVKMVYQNPEFMVETDRKQSTWKQQKAGIRQGCPMSPYLFLIAMKTIFDDIKNKPELKQKLLKNRAAGAKFDEVLYADDTIITSENHKAIETYLHEIEKESEKYGLKLNRKNANKSA